MRIEANLTAELDGKILTIRWKNRRLAKKLRESGDGFLEETKSLEKQHQDGKLSRDKLEEKQEQLLAQFYHDQCDVMFDFEGGTPEVEWFAREDFPVGQMEFLRQVFTNPQIQT